MFGSDWKRPGFPSDFDPNVGQYRRYPKNYVEPDADGTYNGMTEEEFMKFMEQNRPRLNRFLFIPFFNDCHNALRDVMEYGGVHYSGSPKGRFGSTPPGNDPFPQGSFMMNDDD